MRRQQRYARHKKTGVRRRVEPWYDQVAPELLPGTFDERCVCKYFRTTAGTVRRRLIRQCAGATDVCGDESRTDGRQTHMDGRRGLRARQRWSPLCAPWATVTGARLGCTGPAWLKTQVGLCARSDWAVTTTPNAPKAWPQPTLEVPQSSRVLAPCGLPYK